MVAVRTSYRGYLDLPTMNFALHLAPPRSATDSTSHDSTNRRDGCHSGLHYVRVRAGESVEAARASG